MKKSRFNVLNKSASPKVSPTLLSMSSPSPSPSQTLDENCKKLQKLYIKVKDTKLNKTMPSLTSVKNNSSTSTTMPSSLSLQQIDMKSVRVLVERTKFNVMFNLDRHKTPKSLKTQTSFSKSLKSTKKSPSSSKTNRLVELKKTPLKKPYQHQNNTNNYTMPLASSTPQQNMAINKTNRNKQTPNKATNSENSKNANSNSNSNTNQQTIDGIFKIRKCIIRLPKDKLLLQLERDQLKIPYPVGLVAIQKPPRGRPRNPEAIVGEPITPSTPIGQKRKSSEKSPNLELDSNQPKRKLKKANEFFINIGSLTRSPSPRRRGTSGSPEDKDKNKNKNKNKQKNKDKEVKKRERAKNVKSPVSNKKSTTTMSPESLALLRNKVGNRYFKSFVKVKRMNLSNSADSMSQLFPKVSSPQLPKKKKKNGKNLSVSFLETVEVFGESTDEEDWFDLDAKNPKRPTVPLDGDNLFDTLKTTSNPARTSPSSSPPAAGGGGNNGSGILKSSILDRKEKISFSPLKEHESPRKEQLKLANESFVPRRSLESQMVDDDERDNVEDLTEAEEPAPESSTVPESDIVNDKEHNFSDSSSKLSNDDDSGMKTHPPCSSEENDASDREDEQNPQDEEELEPQDTSNKSKENKQELYTKPQEDKDESRTEEATNNDTNELYMSAENDDEEKENEEESDEHKNESVEETRNSPKDDSEDEGQKDVNKSRAQEQRNDHETKTSQGEEEVEGYNKRNEEQITKDSNDLRGDDGEPREMEDDDEDEESFTDPSKLVASVLLNNSTEDDQNEAEAVLDDVCRMAVAESAAAALLNPTDPHLAYNSPHSVIHDDDDDDFNSVLTHPETEKTLQSTAASALVPNSQEIAVASQASALVAPIGVDVDVNEDAFTSVIAEVERFTKEVVSSEMYSADITGADVMMDNVPGRHSLDDIFDDDDVDDDIMSSLRMSSDSIEIGHHKSLPIRVIETEVMAIPNEPDLIFEKPLSGNTASALNSTNDKLTASIPTTPESNSKLFGRIFQSVKSYVMSPGADKNSSLQD